MNLEILTSIIGVFTGTGALLAGLGYGYGQFKKGVKSVDDETIRSLQRQVEVIGNELNEIKGEYKKLNDKYNHQQGQMKTYKEIATLQDPNFKKVIKTLAETVPKLVTSIQYCQSQQVLKSK